MRNVRIVNDGPTSASVKVFDAETGVPFDGIASIKITYKPDRWVEAKINAGFIETNAIARATFFVTFVNGVKRTRKVKRIELEDGTVLEY